jgi:hypothetical protein
VTALSKVALKARCSGILAKGPHLVREDDHVFLLTEIFPRHPDWAEKQGAGVLNVEVRVSGMYKSTGFWLVRADGTEVDISYRTALDGRGTERARTTKAARCEISAQMGAWKVANPMLEPGMHCDHIEPFDAILTDWLRAVGLEHGEIVVISNKVGFQDLFLSRELALSWQRFHKRRARYQWLAAAENIAKSNKVQPVADDWLTAYEAEEARQRRAA